MTFTNRVRTRKKHKKLAVALLGVTAVGLAGPIQAQTQGTIGQGGAFSPLSPFAPIPTQSSVLPNPMAMPGATAEPAAQPAAAPEAETAAPRRLWSVVPRITARETFTDNVAPASGVKRSDQVTEIAPGVRVDADTARLKFHLDYQLRQLFYAQETDRKNTQNYLNTFGTLEALDKWLFVDVSGLVAQQEISPFRFQTASNVSVNPNRVETSSFRVSPFIRGKLAGSADYELRYGRSTTQSSSAFVADVDTEEWSGVIKGVTPLASLGWAVDASHRNIDYQGGRGNEESRFRGLLAYRIVPEFRVSASAGQETNNFSSANNQTHDTYGYGFDWLPTERTQVSGFREKRFFGFGHTFTAAHRTPLTALKFEDVQDVAVLPARFNTVGLGSIHNLLFAQLTSSIPDPVERSRYVDNLLQQFGISPNAVVNSGFFTSRASLQRRQELSYSLQGARNVLTLSLGQTLHQALGPTAGANDIFVATRNIRQRGYSVSFGHKLTPLTSLNAVASQQHSAGISGSNLSSDIRSLHIGATTQLGPKTSASVGVRRSLFESTLVNHYSENALIGTFTAQF